MRGRRAKRNEDMRRHRKREKKNQEECEKGRRRGMRK